MAKEPKITVAVNVMDPAKFKGDLLAISLLEDTKQLTAEYRELDRSLNSALTQLLKLGDFKAKPNETTILYPTGKSGCPRILVVGLGKRKDLKLNILRQAAGTAFRQAAKLGAARCGLALHLPAAPEKLDPEQIAQVITEGAIFGSYNYKDHISTTSDTPKTSAASSLTLLEPDPRRAAKMKKGAAAGQIIADAQNRARMIANRPGCEINPPLLAKEAQKIARQADLQCTIFDEKKLAKMKMNAILAVGSGSASKPRLTVLKYNGRKGLKMIDVVVIGKAITFDSGGLSLKPSEHMESMKFDKSGGCNTIAILTAAARLKLPLNIVGLIPSAENLPSHTSYRPGDIITTYSGKTIEVQNTDAEGRIILSDALAYAAEMKPKAIIDMATLTGACMVALGHHNAGLFGNNDALKLQLQAAAQFSGEPVWPMPSGPDYLEQMKSKVADLKNVGGRPGGSCTAAAFLGEFVGDVPWAHIDIAATADADQEKPYRTHGATAYGVRLVLEYLRGL